MADDIVKTAREQYERAKEAAHENYDKAAEDLRFMSDEPHSQWDNKDYESRRRKNRPVLQIDQLSQFINQVANDIRMSTPTINVIPAGGNATIELAEIYKGLIKNIEYSSNADSAYDMAALNAIRCGIGWIRVDHDYVDDETLDQELCIKRVVNPLSVYLDPDSVEPDGSDAMFCTIIDKILAKDFKRKYPGKNPVSFEDDRGQVAKDDEYITIAEHFYIEEEDKEIGYGERTRKAKARTVKRCILSGDEVLEETTFPGKHIPVVPVYGQELWVDGKRHIMSLIRNAKDAQRMFNYWASLETELLMRAPKAPIIAAAGSVENYASDYKNPDDVNVIRYDAIDKNGNPVPPPQRMEPPTVPTGVVNARRQSTDDIRSTMGIYDAALGQRSNESSGIAIARRQQQGQVATYHFSDNLVKAITQVGRIIVSASPSIYDTARIVRIIGNEDDSKMVGINGAMAPGQPQTISLNDGKYDVRVVTGPSFTTQRQEASETISEIITARPDLLQVVGDLLFKYADFPGAQQIAERMKRMIDPRLLEGEDAQDPQVQALTEQLQQAEGLLQAAQAEMQALQQQLADKQADLQLKAQTEMSDAEEARAKIEIQVLELRLREQEMIAENKFREIELQLKAQELAMKQAEQIAAAQSAGNQAAVY